MATYKPVYNKEIADELRKKLSSEIEFLTSEGFSAFSLHQEIGFPFGVVLLFPAYLAMLASGKEIIQIQSPLRNTSFHILYTSKARGTYAYVYGLGCKFYTNFTDGTWVVSNTSQKIRDKAVIVLPRNQEPISSLEVWNRHKAKVSVLEAQEKQVNQQLSFESWSTLEKKFDDDSLLSIIGIGLTWIILAVCLLYWLVSRLVMLIGAGS